MEPEKQKICAVICEFNPFHNGHAYLVKEINRLLPDYRLVAAMSGDFVQRAEPAIFDKFSRAKTALENGFSAVIAIPTIFSVASAEMFARGGLDVAIAANASALAFGVESDNLKLFRKIASLHLEPTLTFSQKLKELLKDGMPYAAALTSATVETLGSETIELMSKPNNILAIEYLKAIEKSGKNIQPVPIKRMGNEHNDEELKGTPSASALRKALREGKNIDEFSPSVAEKISDYNVYDNIATAFLKLSNINDIASTPDCAEGLEYKIKENALKYTDLEQIIAHTKSKRYSYARIKRIIAQSLLGIEKVAFEEKEFPAKVMGFKDDKTIQGFRHPIYIKNSEYKDNFRRSIETDVKAAQIAYLCLGKNGNPFSEKPVKLN